MDGFEQVAEREGGVYRPHADGRAQVEESGVRALCERLDFLGGFALCRVRARADRPATFEAPVDREGHLHMQLLLSGDAAFRGAAGEAALRRGTACLFAPRLFHREDAAPAWVAPAWVASSGGGFHAISVDVSRARLSHWLGEDAADRLSGAYRESGGAVADPDGAVRRAWLGLTRRLCGREESAVRRLALESAALSVAFAMIDRLASTARPGSSAEASAARDREAAWAARERLAAAPLDPPGLAELARSLGLSPRRLERAFKAEHGRTPHQFLRESRLDYAYRALEQGEAPLKALAWRLGYRHPTSFTHAFRERFGAPPSAIGPRRQ